MNVVNNYKRRLEEFIFEERLVRKKCLEKGQKLLEDFSFVNAFAGCEYADALEKIGKEDNVSVIDCKELSEKNSFLSKLLVNIWRLNKKNLETFPVIHFKNIDKIKSNSSLEKILLSVFDKQQNIDLLLEGENINLAFFIIIATSSEDTVCNLSKPLSSRIDWNVEGIKQKEHFLRKHFSLIFLFSLFFLLSLVFFLKIVNGRKKK